ncbi:MAG: amino acid adenylation domain-containing protein [bacterium]
MDNLEDLYELSPMQQGMLFHSIYSPESGVYFEQSLFTIKGDLKVSAFQDAWQKVVDRHSILRTSFLWEDLASPVQVVHRHVDVGIGKHDWRNLSADEREQQLQSFIAADRGRDFVLSEAPLIRLTLFRFTDGEYKFLFSRHHLLLDRWSRALLLKEVFASYHAFSRGEEFKLEPPPPYGDYISWLDTQDKRAAENYWRAALEGFVAPTEFAVDKKPERKAKEANYGDERVFLTETTTEKLRAFARENKLTLNVLAQGAWALLLSRYSGEDDVLFGVTVAGRPASLAGVESMIGLFINTLPLRVEVLSNSSVLSWLADLQEKQSTVQQYEYSSLLDIQGWSEVPRGTRLFESIFVFENLPVGSSYKSENGSLEIRSDRGLGSTTGYPLTVLVSPGSRLTVQMVYDSARFDAETIREMLGHYQTLLESLPRNASSAISTVPMLSETERQQILHEWNDSRDAWSEQSLLDLFTEQVDRTPDSPAVLFADRQLSYRELNARANQLAHYLRRSGVGPDARVGICIERGLEMAVGVLGILKAGAAYVPLDPNYPSERLAFMLSDSQCSVILTSEPVVSRLPDTDVKVLCLDRDWAEVAQDSNENPATKIATENLAYVIYTSGSTGWPKGVAMTHRALTNLIRWQLKNHPGAARTLQFASLSFDVSFQELFSTWCSGGTLLLVTDELRRDAVAMLRFLVEQRVERLFLPFVYLQHLAEAFVDGGPAPESLREIITAGEQLEITRQIAQLFERLKGCTLHNHYGPSETHVVTGYSLGGTISEWPALPPIGRPTANTQIHILDRNLQPTPIGVAGELCIGGANVSRGYLNRSELTAERFTPNPFGVDPGARIYRTGDLARYQRDGNIEFLGRIDHQIKLRGFRVELGEIETTLATHSAVREAVVVMREEAGDRRLVGYVVLGDEPRDGLNRELRDFLKSKLPDYMVPSDFVFLEALPLTPSGKINRRALPAPDLSARQSEDLYVAPRNETEEKLAEIWSTVLRRERIGIEDNFFALGGHSLLATQLISRVRQAFNIELPLRCLFDSPTIAGLAEAFVGFGKNDVTEGPKLVRREIASRADDLLARIDDLSDDAVEALLNETLAETN